VKTSVHTQSSKGLPQEVRRRRSIGYLQRRSWYARYIGLSFVWISVF
jgi:hypothetical protein